MITSRPSNNLNNIDQFSRGRPSLFEYCRKRKTYERLTSQYATRPAFDSEGFGAGSFAHFGVGLRASPLQRSVTAQSKYPQKTFKTGC